MGGGCNREPATRNPKPTGPATRCAKPATRNPTRNPGLLAGPESGKGNVLLHTARLSFYFTPHEVIWTQGDVI